MNIFVKYNQSVWERFLQIMQNKWVTHFTSEVSVYKMWYTIMIIVDFKNLISSLNFDS